MVKRKRSYKGIIIKDNTTAHLGDIYNSGELSSWPQTYGTLDTITYSKIYCI